MKDKDGKVISQLCDEDNTLGSKEFEQAMRKQAESKSGGEVRIFRAKTGGWKG